MLQGYVGVLLDSRDAPWNQGLGFVLYKFV